MSLELRISLLTDDDKKTLHGLLFHDYYFKGKDMKCRSPYNSLWTGLVDLGFIDDKPDSAEFDALHTYKPTALFYELKRKSWLVFCLKTY